MKAVGFTRSLPVGDRNCLVDFEIPIPVPGPGDLLIGVEAVSVNPVDTMRRRRAAAGQALERPMILGFDAAGTVVEAGSDTHLFKPGDRVWYSGSIDRSGSNAEFQVMDERIVGRRPENLEPAEAAALPLTALTAWEALFDRIGIPRPGINMVAADKRAGAALPDLLGVPQPGGPISTLLIIGGAGGVGSIAIQLAKRLTGMRVIATASRPASRGWCLEMGADRVADHRSLVESVRAPGREHVDYILNCADTAEHWDAMAELIAPEGKIACIVGSEQPVDLRKLMLKSVTFAWEHMSTRPVFQTDTMQRQHQILQQLAGRVEAGEIRSTLTTTLHGLSAATLRQAHAKLEARRMIGKLSIVY